ncbi:MAG: glycosyl transferase [Sphingobacteriaceae bacterium]|nr:glycosyl transferase [Sphingobacteriaceae bacterium]
MLSVITVVHNHKAMNKLFWAYLKRYTYHPFELVVIDNASTDGSGKLFEAAGAKVLRNEKNFAYPVTQNQGAALATGDYLAFVNNDVLVSRHWDKHLLHIMQAHHLDIISPSSTDRAESREATLQMRRRWKWLRYLCSPLGNGSWGLQTKHRMMYGPWDKFCSDRLQMHQNEVLEGFAGHTLLMHRSALTKLGAWDERILQADFDLYLRSLQRWELVGDIKPIAVAKGVFVHHYGRLTMRSHPNAWVPTQPIIEIEDKWGAQNFIEKTAHLEFYRAMVPSAGRTSS